MTNHKKIIFCFSGPAGSGKSSICQRISKSIDHLRLSISTTTRPPRVGEIDGVDYYFVTREEFQRRVASGDFLEHAEYSGNMYGTEKRNVEAAFLEGSDLLFDIEVQGVEQVKQIYGSEVVTVFVCPPSLKVLEERIRKRGKDSEEQIQSRLKIAVEEMGILFGPTFSDYVLVNDLLDEVVGAAEAIVQAERVRLSRMAQSVGKKLKLVSGLGESGERRK